MAIEISDKTKTDTKEFRKVLEIDPKTGLSTVKSEWYEGVVKDFGLDLDTVATVRKIDTHVANVVALGIGEEATHLAKKHKELDRVQVRVQADGKNAFAGDWKRRIETMNPTTKEKGEKFGVVNVKFDFYGTGTHGEMKVIREHIAELGAASLAD
jgi:hypothetical protein